MSSPIQYDDELNVTWLCLQLSVHCLFQVSNCTNGDGRCSLVNANNVVYLLYSPTTTTQFVHRLWFTPSKITHDAEPSHPVFWTMAANTETVQHLQGSFSLLAWNVFTLLDVIKTTQLATFASTIQVKSCQIKNDAQYFASQLE